MYRKYVGQNGDIFCDIINPLLLQCKCCVMVSVSDRYSFGDRKPWHCDRLVIYIPHEPETLYTKQDDFRTLGNGCPEFQSQGGPPCLHPLSSELSDSPVGQHLLTSEALGGSSHSPHTFSSSRGR